MGFWFGLIYVHVKVDNLNIKFWGRVGGINMKGIVDRTFDNYVNVKLIVISKFFIKFNYMLY